MLYFSQISQKKLTPQTNIRLKNRNTAHAARPGTKQAYIPQMANTAGRHDSHTQHTFINMLYKISPKKSIQELQKTSKNWKFQT